MRSRGLLFTLLLLLLAASAGPGASANPTASRLFLPLVMTGAPPARGLFGLELTARGSPELVARANSAGAGWLRLNGLAWRDVEPAPDAGYSWDAPATQALEVGLRRAAELKLPVVLVIHGSPTWAVAPYSANCAPISSAHYERFTRFAAAAVARYSAPPFAVRYYELGNEPDSNLFTVDSPFGCWGRADAPLYGGGDYGRLLKVAYPAIKAASPEAQVLSGGLLLDAAYDPRTGSGAAGRFLEGMLEAGAGGSFDILAFHSYSYYDGTPDGHAGAQDWKPGYLRGVLSRYGLSKPLFNSESALLCPEATAACATAQAYAIPRLYLRALRDGLIGQVWFTYDSDSFHNTALVAPGNPQQERPAHRAFVQASRALAGLRYGGPVGGMPPGAEGYSLMGDQVTTAVLWSSGAQTMRLPVPPGAQVRCAAWDGASLICAPSDGALVLSLGPDPLYVTVGGP